MDLSGVFNFVGFFVSLILGLIDRWSLQRSQISEDGVGGAGLRGWGSPEKEKCRKNNNKCFCIHGESRNHLDGELLDYAGAVELISERMNIETYFRKVLLV